jgi:hypothetical protein
VFLNNLDHPVNITNGPKGLDQIDSIKFFGIDLGKPLSFRASSSRRSRCTTTCSWRWWWSAW